MSHNLSLFALYHGHAGGTREDADTEGRLWIVYLNAVNSNDDEDENTMTTRTIPVLHLLGKMTATKQVTADTRGRHGGTSGWTPVQGLKQSSEGCSSCEGKGSALHVRSCSGDPQRSGHKPQSYRVGVSARTERPNPPGRDSDSAHVGSLLKG